MWHRFYRLFKIWLWNIRSRMFCIVSLCFVYSFNFPLSVSIFILKYIFMCSSLLCIGIAIAWMQWTYGKSKWKEKRTKRRNAMSMELNDGKCGTKWRQRIKKKNTEKMEYVTQSKLMEHTLTIPYNKNNKKSRSIGELYQSIKTLMWFSTCRGCHNNTKWV